MKILIFGAGALGSLFGGLLSRKYDVTLLGKREHIHTIKKKGLKIYGNTRLHCYPRALTSTKENYALVILTVKAYDTLAACKELKKNLVKGSVVLSTQNGLNNEILASELRESVLRGVTSQGAFILKPGEIYHAGKGETVIGEFDGKETARVKETAKIFNSVGIETRTTNEIIRELWVKVIINSCINPLTAITGLKNCAILEDNLKILAEAICKEAVEIANSICDSKFSYNKVMKKVLEVASTTKNNKSSMLQDLEKGKRTEIDFINGKIVEFGKKLGIETTINSAVVELVKSVEQKITYTR